MAKRVDFWQCEKCSEYYTREKDACKCEARHMGISYTDYKKYVEMLKELKSLSSNMSNHNNDRTVTKYNEMCSEVVKFEVEHGIEGDKKVILEV